MQLCMAHTESDKQKEIQGNADGEGWRSLTWLKVCTLWGQIIISRNLADGFKRLEEVSLLDWCLSSHLFSFILINYPDLIMYRHWPAKQAQFS